MSNPFVKKRGDSPPPKTTFQRELNQKMRERAKKGLAVDVSPQDSDSDDDDGIEDDNELLAGFNATIKPKGLGHLRDKDPMNRTIKIPLQPFASRRGSSPPLSNSKGQKLGSMGEVDEDLSEDSDEEPKKPRPSFLRSQQSKEPALQRPKSPSIYGRHRASPEFDEVDSKRLTREPQKRSGTPSKEPEERKSTSGRSTPRSAKSPSISRKPSDDNLGQKFPSGRQTPAESRKSPSDSRRSPSGDRESFGDSRKTPTHGLKSPKPNAEIRRTPFEGLESSELFGDKRKTPVEGGHKSPKPTGNGRRTPVEGHKSPRSNAENHRTAVEDHKSPNLFAESRKTPPVDRKSPGPHLLKKKSSVLDFLEDSNSAANESSDEEELRKVEGQRKKKKKKDSESPEIISVRIESTTQKDESSYDKPNHHLSDGETSVCEEKLEEPVIKKETNTPNPTKEKTKFKAVRIQRTGQKAADEVIEVLADAQNGTHKMKYIDAVKNDAFKSESVNKTRSPSSKKILKPKAIYSSSGTLSRTSGSSTEALNFDSTKDIRHVVYEVWKVQATQRVKQTAKERKEKEKEQEEKNRKDKEEKTEQSVATFEAWMKKKKGFISTKTVQAKKEEEKKKEEEEKRKRKKKESEELFLKWKDTKDVVLKEKYREKLKAIKKEEKEKEDLKLDKQKDAESAFKKWSENKDEHLKSWKKEELRRAEEKKEYEERQSLKQQKSARELYEKWLEQKERQEVALQRKKQLDSNEEDDRRPWRPSSMKIVHIH